MEQELLNYGVLGVWTIFNITTILYHRKKEDENDKKLHQLIENNTVAMTKMYEAVKSCPKR